MSSSASAIHSYTIKDLFESQQSYVIPVYQRNYAWGLGEITQLVQDIQDYVEKETPYYIGTLVVAEKEIDDHTFYETIDGQQRLTTLTILLNAIHRYCYKELQNPIHLNLQLKFHSRPKSTETLHAIATKLDAPVNFVNSREYNVNIRERYFDAENLLEQLFRSKQQVLSFYKYLVEKVVLVRVSVPTNTDLNHYFEVMNNRGEQLEKHEVLKANLLSLFGKDDRARNGFSKIWEAVSDMERYLQYGFSISERDNLFGNDDAAGNRWNTLQVSSFGAYLGKLDEAKSTASGFGDKPMSIVKIVKYAGAFDKNTDHKEDAPERFNSVINFQSFLLHILKIQTQRDIPLDDKKLIDVFKVEIDSRDKAEDFAYNLLKGKYLFDQYIIKREFIGEKDNWSLKRLKWYGTGGQNKISYVNSFGEDENSEQNRNILMLLSMFHVSLPSMNYKHWLSASLNFLFKKETVDAGEYANYLYKVAQSYFYDRILNDEELDYFEMIFELGYEQRKVALDNLKIENLNKGTAVENFAFNFIDYLLWKANKQDFEYTFRSSVEHYYPQNPINGIKLDDERVLNLFGNLCLISSSKNSKLSNYMPIAKKDHYQTQKRPDSIKQKIMMNQTDDANPWDIEAIKKHQEEMISLIKKHFQYADE